MIVGRVEQNARSLETRMHDLAAHGRSWGANAVDIVALDFGDFAQPTMGVESKCRFAGRCEKQIIDKQHIFSSGFGSTTLPSQDRTAHKVRLGVFAQQSIRTAVT